MISFLTAVFAVSNAYIAALLAVISAIVVVKAVLGCVDRFPITAQFKAGFIAMAMTLASICGGLALSLGATSSLFGWCCVTVLAQVVLGRVCGAAYRLVAGR